MFAEDVGLLPENLFTRLAAATRTNPEAFSAQLRQLFGAMRAGGFFGFEPVPRFNGGLFDDEETLYLDTEGLGILRRVSTLDWSSVEPAILGTLFERSLDPNKRAQLGAHYTSREDILAVVEPVLMAPLRRKWEEVRERAAELAERRDAATGGRRTRTHNELARLLEGFAGEIASVRVLDPACGSGNFLYVSLKQLLDLEKEVIAFAGDVGLAGFFPKAGPEQVHGIEVNDYAHELATATVWIGYIDFGTDMSLEDAALYEAPFEHVNEHVRPMRESNNRKVYRELWWIHMEPRPAMRRALAGLPRFLCTPRVAKHRLFVWLQGHTLADSATIAFARDDDYFFGVLHSRAHELWSLRMGTFLGVGNDPRYTPTTCFETFPLPWPPGEEPVGDHRVEAVAEAARRLDELRRNWLNPEGTTEKELKRRTLTNLYNDRPTWLANAHAKLDRAVFAAYGWPEDLSDEEILKNLLALNRERSGAGPGRAEG